MTSHRIDVHHHILPPEYVAEVGGERIGAEILAGKVPDWSPQHSIDAMDRNGIATAITSVGSPGLWVGDVAKSQRLTRHCNDFAATIREGFPGRFGFFGALPMPDVDTSLAEIAYALDELKAEGIGFLSSYDNRYLGDPAFAPIFDELNRRHAVVHVHPTKPPCTQCQPELPAATLDFPFDTTRAIVSLLFSGTFGRCPDIRFIFSHAGGTVPFLAHRIGRLAARPDHKETLPNGVLPDLSRQYYDTALSANELIFASLLTLVAPEKILFGSDYPFAPEATMTATVKGLIDLDLEPAVLQGIERDNALALFPHLAGA